LNRRKPNRESTGIMLDQYAHEAFHRAEQRPVDHVWPVFLAVLADVSQVEALRQVEIKLDRAQLPFAPERIPELEVDLRPVEGRFALIDLVWDFGSNQRFAQGFRRGFPGFWISSCLFRVALGNRRNRRRAGCAG
jgi:hypothetical protein